MTYPIEHDKIAGSGDFVRAIAGEDLGNRKLVYLNTVGTWSLADADAAATMRVVGITMHAFTAGKPGWILLRGFIGLLTWTWTISGEIYATSTPGEISQTAPSAIRQTLGRATSAIQIEFNPNPVENVIYWSDDARTKYCETGAGRCDEVLSGDEWWVVDRSFGEVYKDSFNGIFDITSLGIATIISNYAYYAVNVGAGTFLTNDGPSAGMRLTTGALANNSNLVATGDNSGPAFTWNPTQTVWMHLHYRFPNAGDAANVEFLGAFYQDANNYVGIRYDTAVDNNLRLVTRAAAAETLTVVGPLDTDWHEIYVKFGTGEVRFNQDGAVSVHTTNVPTGNFTWRTYLETLNAVAKNYDVAHLVLVQDSMLP